MIQPAVNRPWFQLVASLIAMVMIANLQYAWTLFVRPIQEATSWKLSEIQWAFTLFVIFQTWVQPLQGWLIDRMGPRYFITIAGILCGVGWSWLGYVRSPMELYVFYSLAGVGAAFVYNGSIGLALKWFPERRGLASGHNCRGIRFRHGFVRARHSLLDPPVRLSHGISLDRHLSGPVHRHCRPVPEASGTGLPGLEESCAAARCAGRPGIYQRGDASNTALLHALCDVRADGDRRPACHRACRSHRAFVEHNDHSLDGRDGSESNRQRREPHLLGLGFGPDRTRDSHGGRFCASGGLPCWQS